VKGNIYEGLLARNAEDVKSGAGQYFYPAAVDRGHGAGGRSEAASDRPRPGLRHGGLPARRLGTHEEARESARDRGVYSALKNKFSGVDIVPEVVRLAAMNLYLHGITGVDSIVEAKDALLARAARAMKLFSQIRPSARSRATASSATTARSIASAGLRPARLFCYRARAERRSRRRSPVISTNTTVTPSSRCSATSSLSATDVSGLNC
jgi:N-6 DNA Methylase